MTRFAVDSRNRLIFYGNMVGYVKDKIAVVDEMFKTDELNQYLSRLELTPKWENGIYDRLSAGEVPSENPEVELFQKGCRIWQLKNSVDVTMRFIGYEDFTKKFGEPTVDSYEQVYEGDPGTNDLEKIYSIFRDDPPPEHRGHRMALSDVVELYDEAGSDFYYCDRIGFRPIRFVEQEQTKCMDMTM